MMLFNLQRAINLLITNSQINKHEISETHNTKYSKSCTVQKKRDRFSVFALQRERDHDIGAILGLGCKRHMFNPGLLRLDTVLVRRVRVRALMAIITFK